MPLATGKLSIWTAKTNAATSPASGARRSSSSSAALRTQTPSAGRGHARAGQDVGPSMNPSGMCTPPPSVTYLRPARIATLAGDADRAPPDRLFGAEVRPGMGTSDAQRIAGQAQLAQRPTTAKWPGRMTKP